MNDTKDGNEQCHQHRKTNMVKKLIVISQILITTCAYAESKSNIFIVGGNNKINESLKNGLINEQEKIDTIKSYVDEINRGLFKEGIAGLEDLFNNEDYFWYKDELLEHIRKAYIKESDLESAIKTQKRIVRLGTHAQYFNSRISTLRELIDEYKAKRGNNFEALNEQSEIDNEVVKNIFNEYKKNYKSDRYALLKVAAYYYGRLHFEEAENTYLKGLRTQRINYHDNAEDYYFHEGLRNLFMIQGRYVEALKENEWIVEDTRDKQTVYYQDRVNLSEFLRRADKKKLDPKKIQYIFEINRDLLVSEKA
ncbi:MAG: hypothetical protein HY226_04435 [Candidatus Vogelbacteria bacterium]|nr:hypothetical protein [Candidatus Vogelbacteria bacterium]